MRFYLQSAASRSSSSANLVCLKIFPRTGASTYSSRVTWQTPVSTSEVVDLVRVTVTGIVSTVRWSFNMSDGMFPSVHIPEATQGAPAPKLR